MFTPEQIAFMKSIGLDLDFDNPDDDSWVEIEDRVGDMLVYYGEYNKVGSLMCESIFDKIPK